MDGTIDLHLADDAATARLGQDIAAALKLGDLVALDGDLGMGKTALARAMIRSLAGDAALEVPSPTFTLVQVYELKPRIHHFDFYRLGDPSELVELGLDEALEDGVALVEWPERAGDRLPVEHIRVALTADGDGRRAVITGPVAAMTRISRSLKMRAFLEASGWLEATRAPLTGDASARAYERVWQEGRKPLVLMNSPPLVLGPPVRGDKAYAEIAHTSRTVEAFVAMAGMLRGNGFAVPAVEAADLSNGFALLENLGSGNFLHNGQPVADRYAAAAALLADVHRIRWPEVAKGIDGARHRIPPFDRAAMQIEADLLIDWYLPAVTGNPATDSERTEYVAAWNEAFDRLANAEISLVMRDYHSPNIIWRAERSGSDRLGLVDFQDALIGPAAYDVASLAMDARVSIPEKIERAAVDAYVAARAADAGFSKDGFAEAYAIMAAQRNAKILGIFVRLNRRDGKPAYLAHLPRIRDYLRRATAHPALARLRAFLDAYGILEERAL